MFCLANWAALRLITCLLTPGSGRLWCLAENTSRWDVTRLVYWVMMMVMIILMIHDNNNNNTNGNDDVALSTCYYVAIVRNPHLPMPHPLLPFPWYCFSSGWESHLFMPHPLLPFLWPSERRCLRLVKELLVVVGRHHLRVVVSVMSPPTASLEGGACTRTNSPGTYLAVVASLCGLATGHTSSLTVGRTHHVERDGVIFLSSTECKVLSSMYSTLVHIKGTWNTGWTEPQACYVLN